MFHFILFYEVRTSRQTLDFLGISEKHSSADFKISRDCEFIYNQQYQDCDSKPLAFDAAIHTKLPSYYFRLFAENCLLIVDFAINLNFPAKTDRKISVPKSFLALPSQGSSQDRVFFSLYSFRSSARKLQIRFCSNFEFSRQN